MLEEGECVALLDEKRSATAVAEVVEDKGEKEPMARGVDVRIVEVKDPESTQLRGKRIDLELGLLSEGENVTWPRSACRRVRCSCVSEDERRLALGKEYGEVKLDAFHLLTRLAGAVSSDCNGQRLLQAASSALFYESLDEETLNDLTLNDGRVPKSRRFEVKRQIPDPSILLQRLSVVEENFKGLFGGSEKLQEVCFPFSKFFLKMS